MKKTAVIVAMLAALSSPVFGQGTAAAPAEPAKAPAAAAKDPVVQQREELAAADAGYKKKKAALDADHKAKMQEIIDKELKNPAAKGKEPQVARRDAEAKARKATKADYDAKVKALRAEHRTARQEINKKYPAPAKTAAKN
jgi:hypothetical protein